MTECLRFQKALLHVRDEQITAAVLKKPRWATSVTMARSGDAMNYTSHDEQISKKP